MRVLNRCPACGSDDVMLPVEGVLRRAFRLRRGQWYCFTCEHRWRAAPVPAG